MPPRRTCHLRLTFALWERLRRAASEQQLPISWLCEDLLRRSLDGAPAIPLPTPASATDAATTTASTTSPKEDAA